MIMIELYEQLTAQKGFTLTNKLQEVEEKGYFVSLPKTETRVPIEYFTYEVMINLVNEYRKNTNLIGAWFDNGIVYFDNSVLIKDLPTAIDLAIQYNQIAIYDNENKRSLYIIDAIDNPNTYEIVPETT
jgi:hypothetical protein